MANNARDYSSTELAYKNFKLPILQVSKRQFCNKVVHDFRKSLQQHKSSHHRKDQSQNKEIVKKLKLVSLIKSDKGSLSTVPINERYCPYKRIERVVQTDFRKIVKRKQTKSHDRASSKDRCKTQDKSLLIYKMDMNINLSQCHRKKMDYKNYFPSQRAKKSHKRAETQGIYNFLPASERTIKQKQYDFRQENEAVDLFLTEGIESREDEQLNSQTKRCNAKLKPMVRSNFLSKYQNNKKNSIQSRIMNQSIRGWTRYGKCSEIAYLDQIDQELPMKKRQKFQ